MAQPADAKTWYLQIGNERLDERRLTMVGGGRVVGTIPEGLPALQLPHLDPLVMLRLFMMGMIISLLGFVEAISIAKAMAARTQQRLDPNQELIGQGLSNMIGCLGQSYPVSGSFSRSAVNLQAGAVTGVSNVACSAVVALVVLFVTPLLYHLPHPTLAAVIMMAVIGLLNVRGFLHAWKARRFDGAVVLITFIATLYFAPHLEWGIALGVGLSLARYLHTTMRPPIADLSLHPDGSLRDARRHRLRRCKYIAAIRFDGPSNFANTSYLEDAVMERVTGMPELRHVLIVAHGINELDASGEELLRKLGGLAPAGSEPRVLDAASFGLSCGLVSGCDREFPGAAGRGTRWWTELLAVRTYTLSLTYVRFRGTISRSGSAGVGSGRAPWSTAPLTSERTSTESWIVFWRRVTPSRSYATVGGCASCPWTRVR